MTCNIISTGSKGNAVLLGGTLLLDCGVPFQALSGIHRDVKLVALTHIHGDHFNRATLKRLAFERPTLRFGCCGWLVPELLRIGVSAKSIDVYEFDSWFHYGGVSVSPFQLFHNVPNCGYRITLDGEKALYATDTGRMDGVEAVGYDLYLIEANHTEAELAQRIADKLEAGEFSYEYRVAMDHLSKERADAFLSANARCGGRYVYLHEHRDAAYKVASAARVCV